MLRYARIPEIVITHIHSLAPYGIIGDVASTKERFVGWSILSYLEIVNYGNNIMVDLLQPLFSEQLMRKRAQIKIGKIICRKIIDNGMTISFLIRGSNTACKRCQTNISKT